MSSLLEDPQLVALLEKAQKEFAEINADEMKFEERKPISLKLDAGVSFESETAPEDDVLPSMSTTKSIQGGNGPYIKRQGGVYRVESSLLEVGPPKKEEPKKKSEAQKHSEFISAELTPQAKLDLLLIRNRAALDPKQFYKKDSSAKTLPKTFQIGTIVETKADFYSGRLTNKERKQTIIETLMEDADKRQYFKRKFLEIQDKKAAGGKKWYNSKRKKRN